MNMSHELDVDYEEHQVLRLAGVWATETKLVVFCREDDCPFEIEPDRSVSTSDLMTWQFNHRMDVLKNAR